jgi:aryl-alcohol dehydrogenase-like predicted oxidoreductase
MASLKDKLVLGTVQLGMNYGINNSAGQPSADAAFEILQAAHEAGITMLDTADAYGNAIERIGAYHEASSHAPFRIITKFHVGEQDTALEFKAAQTLDKLNVRSLYCYQFHRFQDVAEIVAAPERFSTIPKKLVHLKSSGAIERVGVSVYTNEEFAEAIASEIIDVIQLPFNLLDSMRLRGDLMQKAVESGKELHTRSVFLQGLFFKETSAFPITLASLAAPVQRLRAIAHEQRLSMATLALGYVLHNSLISYVLFGVETPAQLRETLAAVPDSWSEELSHEIEAVVVEDARLLNPATWL